MLGEILLKISPIFSKNLIPLIYSLLRELVFAGRIVDNSLPDLWGKVVRTVSGNWSVTMIFTIPRIPVCSLPVCGTRHFLVTLAYKSRFISKFAA